MFFLVKGCVVCHAPVWDTGSTRGSYLFTLPISCLLCGTSYTSDCFILAGVSWPNFKQKNTQHIEQQQKTKKNTLYTVMCKYN